MTGPTPSASRVAPGQTVTFVTEITVRAAFPQMALWKPLVYEKKLRDRTLFNGIMMGIVGLLAIFMTAIFGANHKLIFPSMALVAWSVLAYLCVDFGFWHKIFQLRPDENALYRAVSEAGDGRQLCAVPLRLPAHRPLAHLLPRADRCLDRRPVAIVVGAALDPRFAVTLARLSFAAARRARHAVHPVLALRGQDRALSLVPSWLLFVVWVLGAGAGRDRPAQRRHRRCRA